MQLLMYPYVFHILFGLPPGNVMAVVFLGVVVVYDISNKHRYESVPNQLIQIMLVQSFIWIIYFLYYNDTSYLVRIFFILLAFASIRMLQGKSELLHFSKVYNVTLTIQGVLGVVAFVLVYINILKPVFIHYYSDYRYLNWYIITCSNAVYDNFMRVGGFFDEPGALAFWGIFALLFNRFTYNNRRIEILLLISLLFTFSAAYFILLPLYLLFFYAKEIKHLVITIVVVVPLLFVGFNYLSGDANFAHYTTERFVGGEIRSTRYDQSDYTKKIFEQSPIMGIGAKNLSQDTETTDNPYEILAKDGILGFIATYLPLIFITIKYRKNRNVLCGTILLFLDYMQRPFHINELHFFMLYLYCTIIIRQSRNEFKTENI